MAGVSWKLSLDLVHNKKVGPSPLMDHLTSTELNKIRELVASKAETRNIFDSHSIFS